MSGEVLVSNPVDPLSRFNNKAGYNTARRVAKRQKTEEVKNVDVVMPQSPASVNNNTSKKRAREIEDKENVSPNKRKAYYHIDTLQKYDEAQVNNDPHLAVKEVEQKEKDYVLKVKDGMNEYTVHEKSLEEQSDLQGAADIIAKIEAKEELEELIAKYKRKLENFKDGGDFDRMAMDAHILIMLYVRRDGGNSQDLEEIAQLHVIILRDKIKQEHQSWSQFAYALVSGSLMIAGSVVGISGVFGAASKVNSLVKSFNNLQSFFKVGEISKAKDLIQVGTFIGQTGQGVQSIGSYSNGKSQGILAVYTTDQQIAQQKQNQNRDEKRRSDQAVLTAINTIKEILRNRNQTVLVFARGNSY